MSSHSLPFKNITNAPFVFWTFVCFWVGVLSSKVLSAVDLYDECFRFHIHL